MALSYASPPPLAGAYAHFLAAVAKRNAGVLAALARIVNHRLGPSGYQGLAERQNHQVTAMCSPNAHLTPLRLYAAMIMANTESRFESECMSCPTHSELISVATNIRFTKPDAGRWRHRVQW